MAWNYNQQVAAPQPQRLPHKTIAILLPHRDNWYAEFVEATWGPLKYQPTDWCNKMYFLARVPSLPLSRNNLVAEFLKSPAEYCFWLDSDVIPHTPPNPNDAMKILYSTLESTGESIATGLYRAKQVHGFNWSIWKQVNLPGGKVSFTNLPGWPEGVNWFTVDVAGAGCLMMHRRVFEAMRDAGIKNYFHWEEPGSMSEDFHMLTEAKKLGFSTWCRSDVQFSHMGTLVVDPDGGFRVPRV